MSGINRDVLLVELNNALDFFERSTRSLDEEDSDFAPADGTYTAANHVAHVALTIDWFLAGAFSPNNFDMNIEEHDRQARAVRSLREARGMLQRSVDNARRLLASTSDEEWAEPIAEGPVLGGLPRAAIFSGITDHTAHHRGALTIYARLRGKTPPMPYGDEPTDGT